MRRRKFHFYSSKTLKKITEKYALFSNSTTFITTPIGKGWNPSTTPRSFTFWVKPSNTSGTKMVFSHNWVGNNRLYLAINSSQWQVGIQSGGTTLAGSTNRPTANVWSFVVLTYDGTAARLYVNGSMMQSVAYSSFVTDNNITLGNRGDAAGSFPYMGALDDFAVYDKALSDAEVLQLMSGSPTGHTSNLLTYYKFDGDAKDSSGKGADGVMSSDVTFENRRTYTQFDGVNDYINIPNTNNKFNITGSSTVEFWLNSSVGAAEGFAMICSFNSMPSDRHFAIIAGAFTSNLTNEALTLVSFNSLNGGTSIHGYAPVDLTALKNRWVHVAAVLTPTDWTMYLDGVAVTLANGGGSKSGTWFDRIGNITSLTLGRREYHNQYGNFKMSDFRVWDKALTGEEVKTSMKTKYTTPQPNLIGNWILEENFSDYSGNNLQTTPFNGVVTSTNRS